MPLRPAGAPNLTPHPPQAGSRMTLRSVTGALDRGPGPEGGWPGAGPAGRNRRQGPLIIRPSSRFEVPSASRERINRSTETPGSPASILATRD